MTAKEMFEKLGYKLKYENRDVKKYLMVKHIPNRIDTKYINFTEIEFALNGVKVGSWETNAYIERTKTFDYTFLPRSPGSCSGIPRRRRYHPHSSRSPA